MTPKSKSYFLVPAPALVAFVAITATILVRPNRALGNQGELAKLDAAATMLGSIRSWVNSEPEAAIHAFREYEHIRRYLEAKYGHYQGSPQAARIGDRMKAIESGVEIWEEFVPKYRANQPKQIAAELKRQRDAVARYKKSKSPRPSSFAYIPKTVWQTKNKLDVLTSSGVDTEELRAEQQEVQSLVLKLLATLDDEQIAKKNGYVRDAYKRPDRDRIEEVVRKAWSNSHPELTASRIVMPQSSWANTYAARTDQKSGEVVPYEVERMTVYVACEKTDSILTLHPIRLMREHYRVNGKRLGKIGPQDPRQIPTNEFAFDVLAKNIR